MGSMVILGAPTTASGRLGTRQRAEPALQRYPFTLGPATCIGTYVSTGPADQHLPFRADPGAIGCFDDCLRNFRLATGSTRPQYGWGRRSMLLPRYPTT